MPVGGCPLDWEDPIVNTRWPRFESVDNAPSCIHHEFSETDIGGNWISKVFGELKIDSRRNIIKRPTWILDTTCGRQPPLSNCPKNPEYKRNIATGRVKLAQQVFDPTCLLIFVIVYIAYIAWLLHTHTTHTLHTIGHLHINSCHKQLRTDLNQVLQLYRFLLHVIHDTSDTNIRVSHHLLEWDIRLKQVHSKSGVGVSKFKLSVNGSA